MKTKKIVLAVFSVLFLLLISGSLHADHWRFTDNLRGEKVLLPGSAPNYDRLILVAFFTVVPEAGVIVALAVYDDPRTRRQVDYWELYDDAGGLLLISWVDRFGIVSRGCRDPSRGKLHA